ncbi:ribulose-phosphate 3-epimerase [Alkalihalophilus pseudofirmus]|uniref:ribulose-phosphate 3-epimerase n=1 Tax=Alkalihalophilus pseudofirmus TaxID=79885 RepID=UPI00259B8B67|nr:ribulose-phosphate 3-epimerase [Alkalihalophilus pseudofirmus]WEG16671.1 ribulose-phosphate 3-epimerase [Alkalihalophilus pseudofirmus]
MQRNVEIYPSIMCADLCNLEQSIKKVENEGIDTLHIDILDGHFSPSMPLGLDTIKQLRKVTNLKFDVHIMSTNNQFFIEEMIDLGVEQITFHIEKESHVDRYIKLIKKNNIKVGIALNPATPISVLDYVLPECDTVLLMLINPGFATDKGEQQVSYAAKKVEDMARMIKERGLSTKIEVDGRVSFDTIPNLVRAGADMLVAGSTSFYDKNNSLKENKAIMEMRIAEGLNEEAIRS